MIQISQLPLPVDYSEGDLRTSVLQRLGISERDLISLHPQQRAIDARRQHVSFQFTVLVETKQEQAILKRLKADTQVRPAPSESYTPPPLSTPEPRAEHRTHQRPVIVGTGPCGLFAGLLLARAGLKPILLERGKAAGDRARDVTGFWRRGWAFDPESNVQFGEGGAGTFSDGKLYTQIRDREGRIPWLLKEMVLAGAPEDILLKARPHIGTDRLIKVVRHVREEIIQLGGEVRFSARVSDIVLEKNRLSAVVLADGSVVEGSAFILAIGHSSRDTFTMLHQRGIPMEAKPFSIGARIEHPQRLIDSMLYGRWAGHDRLGSAPYKFVAHCPSGRSAYSFCMCPGGLVVAANSEANMVVTNGMSSYARAEANANSGFMVDLTPADYGGDQHPLAGIEFQRKIEKAAFQLGGGNYQAPAQLLGDLMSSRASTHGGQVKPSYEPGVRWTDLRECLPEFVISTLQQSLPLIAKKLPGFLLEDAVLTAAETRSSSPIRIPRDSSTLLCEGITNLYPSGEGAGYAGGIISAATDGMKVAEALIKNLPPP